MTPLEQELVDLAPYLAHSDGLDLAAAVTGRLAAPHRRLAAPPGRTPYRGRRALVIALTAAVVAVLAIAPARRAVARLFRIGAVEIHPTGPTSTPAATGSTVGHDATTGVTTSGVDGTGAAPTAGGDTGPATGSSTTTTTTGALAAGGETTTLDDARRRLPFTIRLADDTAGPIRSVVVDASVPGGLVAIAYDGFTLVEVASLPDAYPIMAKTAPPEVTVEFLQVGGHDAVWVRGAHEIVYLGPDGAPRTDTVRRSGSALVWTAGAVTLRIEGLDDRDAAVAVAGGLR